jgi:hypothetical protein
VLLSHNNLANYYSLVFSLAQHHKYSITEIEELVPFERDIYVAMLMDHLEKEKQRNEERAAKMKRKT